MGEVRRIGLIVCLFCVLSSIDKVVDIGEIGFEVEGVMVCFAALIVSWGTSFKDVAGVVVILGADGGWVLNNYCSSSSRIVCRFSLEWRRNCSSDKLGPVGIFNSAFSWRVVSWRRSKF